jgi:hypothetical protein
MKTHRSFFHSLPFGVASALVLGYVLIFGCAGNGSSSTSAGTTTATGATGGPTGTGSQQFPNGVTLANRLGFNTYLEYNQYYPADFQQAFTDINSLSGTSVRLPMNWVDIEKPDGTFNDAALMNWHQVEQEANAKGISVLVVVQGYYPVPISSANPISVFQPGIFPYPTTDLQRQEFVRFLGHVESQLGPQMFELINEPNNPNSTGANYPVTTALVDAYAQLIISAGNAKSSGALKSLIVGPDVTCYQENATGFYPTQTFLTELKSQGADKYFDIFSMQPYNNGAPSGYPEDPEILSDITAYQTEATSLGKKLIASEWGWPADPNDSSESVTQAVQAEMLARCFLVSLIEGIKVDMLYEVFDRQTFCNGYSGACNTPPDPEGYFGLYGPDKITAKPSANAFEAFMSAYGNYTYKGYQQGPDKDMNHWRVDLANGTNTVSCYWSSSASDTTSQYPSMPTLFATSGNVVHKAPTLPTMSANRQSRTNLHLGQGD